MMRGGKPIVAVVDDDRRLLESVENLLESAGYAARVFQSAEALLNSGLSDVDVLITDIGMSGMDGFALRDRAAALRPDLPVFLVTGRHEIADQERARCVSGFFRKPFDGQVLLAAINEALSQLQKGGGV